LWAAICFWLQQIAATWTGGREKRVTIGTNFGTGSQLKLAQGAVEVEAKATFSTNLIVIIQDMATAGTDPLSTFFAKAILDKQG
jgi:hypothetical protein